jgi:spermidine synthase
MAVIWKKVKNNILYEVRTAGNSVRLYSNGVFHTQYNPKQLFTGSVWDLLSIPALLYDPTDIKRILVLGVGGGAIINQFNHFLCPNRIIGIELDPVHLFIAKKFFGLRKKNITLVNQEAKAWLLNYRAAKFDLIVDDLFFEENGEPARAIPADKDWFQLLISKMNPNGMLIQNHVDYRSLRKSGYYAHASVQAHFKSAFRLCSPTVENNVAVFCRQTTDKQQLTKNLKSLGELPVTVNRTKLDYVIHGIHKVSF